MIILYYVHKIALEGFFYFLKYFINYHTVIILFYICLQGTATYLIFCLFFILLEQSYSSLSLHCCGVIYMLKARNFQNTFLFLATGHCTISVISILLFDCLCYFFMYAMIVRIMCLCTSVVLVISLFSIHRPELKYIILVLMLIYYICIYTYLLIFAFFVLYVYCVLLLFMYLCILFNLCVSPSNESL